MMKHPNRDPDEHLANIWQRLEGVDDTPTSTSSESIDSIVDELTPEQMAQLLAANETLALLEAAGNRSDTLRSPSTTCSSPEPKNQSESRESLPRSFGRLTLMEVVGEGGFGRVYKAHDPALDRLVAVKIPFQQMLASPRNRERFRREARATALLDHPNILPVFEAGEIDGQAFLSMAYSNGETLAAYRARSSEQLSIDECVEIMRQVAEALSFAHSKGIVHRDLKPGNILIERSDHDGKPKCFLADFGLAFDTENNERDLTVEGTMVGTPAYMSPEQINTADCVEAVSDIFAFGSVFYELFNGVPPFKRDTTGKTLKAIELDTTPAFKNRNIAKSLQAICNKCLEKDPSQRYSNGFELAADLRRFQSGFPVLAQPISPLSRSWKWAKRNPVVSVSVLTTFLCLLSGLIATTYFWNQSQLAFNQSQVALETAEQAKQEETEARLQAERSRQEAELSAQSAQDAVDAILDSISNANLNKDGKLNLSSVELLRSAEKSIENRFAAEPLAQAKIRMALGRSYQSLDLYFEARNCFQRAFDVFRNELGDEADETLRALTALANAQRMSGQLKASLANREELLRLQELKFGTSDSRTLRSNAAIASLQAMIGNPIDEMASLEQSLFDDNDDMDGGLLARARASDDILGAYQSLKMYEQGMTLAKREWEFRTAAFGADHPQTLMAELQYMFMSFQNRKRKLALEMGHSLWPRIVSSRGATSPVGLMFVHVYSNLLLRAGNLETAQATLDAEIDAAMIDLGPNHPETVKLRIRAAQWL
ncbi:MAG: serine/threonine-protein kinase [Pirellulaceae bacterium]